MEPFQTALLQAGVAGIVLWWFMWRAEKKWDNMSEGLDRVQEAINRQTKAQMLDLISRDDTPPSVKQLAQDLSHEVEEAEWSRRVRSRGGRSGQQR